MKEKTTVIASYSIQALPNENSLTVNFKFASDTMEPSEFQHFFNRIQDLCRDFTNEQTDDPQSTITVGVALDTKPLDEAQIKAEKLKATLSEVLELIRRTNSINVP